MVRVSFGFGVLRFHILQILPSLTSYFTNKLQILQPTAGLRERTEARAMALVVPCEGFDGYEQIDTWRREDNQ